MAAFGALIDRGRARGDRHSGCQVAMLFTRYDYGRLARALTRARDRPPLRGQESTRRRVCDRLGHVMGLL